MILAIVWCVVAGMMRAQQDPICGVIAASNVADITDYMNWQCSATGFPLTDPCTWNGTVCENETITELALGAVGLSGTLPSSLGSMTSLVNILLNSNSLYGSLPSNIACLTSLLFLDLFQNELTGSLPSEFNQMNGLTRLDLSFNQLTGTIPSIGNMSAMTRFQMGDNLFHGPLPDFSQNLAMFLIILNQNYLTGTIASDISLLGPSLAYIYLDDNYLTGSIPSSVGSLYYMYYLDLGDNSLSGTLPSTIGEMSKLVDFKISGNLGITGTIPTSVGMLNMIENLKFEDTNLMGTIPSQLCGLVQDVALNVENTRIHCYGGCLTSQNVNVIGATTVCPDGSVMRKFLVIICITVGISILCTLHYRFSSTLNRTGVSLRLDAGGTAATATINRNNNEDETKVTNESTMPTLLHRCRDSCYHCYFSCLAFFLNSMSSLLQRYKRLFRNTLIIAFCKVLIMLFISLFVARYWTYCPLGTPGSANTEVASCTSEFLGTCKSYCSGGVSETLFTISDDVYAHHKSQEGYCTATFDGSCACQYWQVYRLVPLLLNVLQFVLLVGCFVFYNSFDPQRIQYEIISDHVYSIIGQQQRYGHALNQSQDKELRQSAVKGTHNSNSNHSNSSGSGSTHSDSIDVRASTTSSFISSALANQQGFMDMLVLFFADPLYCYFSFIEVYTVGYVWMELPFSPVSCGNQFQISRLYYPLILTVLDFGKLNFYISLKSFRKGEGLKAWTSLLNLEIFFIYVLISMVLAVIFVVGLIKLIYIYVAFGLNKLIQSALTSDKRLLEGDWPKSNNNSSNGSNGDNLSNGHGSSTIDSRSDSKPRESIYFDDYHLQFMRNRGGGEDGNGNGYGDGDYGTVNRNKDIDGGGNEIVMDVEADSESKFGSWGGISRVSEVQLVSMVAEKKR